jgi:hypothetical protein
MSLSLGNITFDCDDPQKVAAFWAAALDRAPDEGASEFFVALGSPTPGTPTMFFIKVPEGKMVKNRVHLDLGADDRAAEIARLVQLGAAEVAQHDEWGHSWTVLTDVEGNEFCVAQQ